MQKEMKNVKVFVNVPTTKKVQIYQNQEKRKTQLQPSQIVKWVDSYCLYAAIFFICTCQYVL